MWASSPETHLSFICSSPFFPPYYLSICLLILYFRVCFISDFQITDFEFFKELLYMQKASKEQGAKITNKVESLWCEIIRKNTSRSVFTFSLTFISIFYIKILGVSPCYFGIPLISTVSGQTRFPSHLLWDIKLFEGSSLSLVKAQICSEHLLPDHFTQPPARLVLTALKSQFFWHHSLSKMMGSPRRALSSTWRTHRVGGQDPDPQYLTQSPGCSDSRGARQVWGQACSGSESPLPSVVIKFMASYGTQQCPSALWKEGVG